MADIYRRNVAPARATDTLAFARPETFGAAVADGLGNLGNTLARAEVQKISIETQRERDMQASAAALEFAKIQEAAARQASEAQGTAGPGGAGYTDAIGKYLDTERDRLLGSIGDEKVRRSVETRFAEWRGDAMIRAEAWERGQAVKLAADNLDQTLNIRANRAYRGDAEGFTQELTNWKTDLAQLGETLPPEIHRKYEQAGIAEISAKFVEARPPAERLALLDSGMFDALDPSVVGQLRSGAEVDIRRERVEAEARMRVEKADAKDAVDAVIADLGDGIPREDGEITAALDQANKYGLDGEARKLEKGLVENRANREFASASEIQIDDEVKRLNTQIAAQGDKADRETVWRRDHLVELREKRGAQIEDDPAEFATRNGIEWGAVDPTDASSIAARRQAVSKTKALTGRPVPYLLPAEREQLAAQLSTFEGQAAVLRMARAFGRDAPKVMREVDPSDNMLVHALGLEDGWARRTLEGRDLVKRKVYTPPSDLGNAIRTRLGTSLAGLSASAQAGVIDTAKALYVDFMHRRGDDGKELDEGVAAVMVDRALGNTSAQMGEKGGRGGLGFWNGKPFVLPANMSSRDFAGRMSFGRLNNAFHADLETPITPKQLRDNYTPVRLGGTLYGFQTARGEWALTADGKRAQLDVSKLKPPAARGSAAPARKFGASSEQPRARSAYEGL